MIHLPPAVSARFQLLMTRAALPAWTFSALLLIAEAREIFHVVDDSFGFLRSVRIVGWLFSPIGLLLLAVTWLGWLLIRPADKLKELERVERVRSLLREAANRIRTDADADHAAARQGELRASYSYMHAMDFIDDACVASVNVALHAFVEREGRMYKAADVPFDAVRVAADYLDRLADHLTLAQLDPGFRVPESFAEWSDGHKANIRPVRWHDGGDVK